MRFIFVLFISISSLFSFTLELTLEGVKNKGGNIYIGLYDNQKSFLKEELVFIGKIIKDSKSYIKLENIPSGTYAISLYHDENNNNRLDKNFIGIPKEGYGFSNNPNIFGKPDFEDAKFELNSDKQLTIEVKY